MEITILIQSAMTLFEFTELKEEEILEKLEGTVAIEKLRPKEYRTSRSKMEIWGIIKKMMKELGVTRFGLCSGMTFTKFHTGRFWKRGVIHFVSGPGATLIHLAGNNKIIELMVKNETIDIKSEIRQRY